MATGDKTAAPSHRDFFHGFAIAVAYVARNADRPSLAKDMMVSNGISVADLKSAGVEGYDLIPIERAMA